MRRIFLSGVCGLGVVALLAMGAGRVACAQHRGGAQIGFPSGGFYGAHVRAGGHSGFNPAPVLRPRNRGFDRDHDGDRDRGHDGGRGRGRGRGHFRGRYLSGYGLGYGYLPYGYGYGYAGYDAGYDYPADYASGGYSNAPQVIVVQPPPEYVQRPAPPAAKPARAVIEEYKWPAKGSSRPSATEAKNLEQKDFGIVLKNGSVLTAETVFAAGDGIHYVDPDGRHMLVAMSNVDRAATLKLNRERNLSLYLPAPE